MPTAAVGSAAAALWRDKTTVAPQKSITRIIQGATKAASEVLGRRWTRSPKIRRMIGTL
jgi:hypothetical protein